MENTSLNEQLVCDGAKVKELRQNAGMTQEKLGIMCRLTTRTVQRVESGENISLESVASIASALKVTVSDILTRKSLGETAVADIDNNAVVLRRTTSGKAVLDHLKSCFTGTIECLIEPTSENIELLSGVIDEIEALIPEPWRSPFDNNGPLSLSQHLRAAVRMTERLKDLDDQCIGVFVGEYTSSAQIPRWDPDEGVMSVRLTAPYKPVTICKVVIGPINVQTLVVKVTDKWEELKPLPSKASEPAPFDDDIPF